MDLMKLLLITVISVTLQTHPSTVSTPSAKATSSMRYTRYAGGDGMNGKLFGGAPVPGTIGGDANITCYFKSFTSYPVGGYDSWYESLDSCSFSNKTACTFAFYRNKNKINITNDLRYSIELIKSGYNLFSPITKDTNTILEKIIQKNNDTLRYGDSAASYAITLTIKNLTSSDFSNNYSCIAKWYSYGRFYEDRTSETKDIILYDKDEEYTESNIFYYTEAYQPPYGKYRWLYSDTYFIPPSSRLFQCGFYNTAVESIKWYIKTDNGTFDDIYNYSSDYWRSFQIYNVTHQEGFVVETFLLLTNILSPVKTYQIYCVDMKNVTKAKSETFSFWGRQSIPHLDRHEAHLYWFYFPSIVCAAPTVSITIFIFIIFACVRGQCCKCCRKQHIPHIPYTDTAL